MAGFTALTEAHGDLDAAGVAARFEALARGALVEPARLVKTMGDAVMVVAPDAGAAVATALALGAAIEGEPLFPAVAAGVHCGSAVERDGDWFGAAVNLAARIAAYARPGQLLCTEGVAEAARALGSVEVHAVGQVSFRNVTEPVELFELHDLGRAVAAAEVDPVCRMRVDPGEAAGTRRTGASGCLPGLGVFQPDARRHPRLRSS